MGTRPTTPAIPFTSAPTVLVTDDESHIRRFVRAVLEEEGCEVHGADRVEHGLIEAGIRQPDTVTLDLGPPDGDDMQLIRELRAWTEMPVPILSARVDERGKIEALDADTDDYLTKLLGMDRLAVRLRVLSRWHAERGENGGSVTRFDGVETDLARRLVSRNGEAVRLTSIEYRLLAVLLGRRDAMMAHRELLREVWGSAHSSSSHYLRIYVGHLHHKLEHNPTQPEHLLTEVGVGHQFTA